MGNVERAHNDAMFGVMMAMNEMHKDSVFVHYYNKLGEGHEGTTDPRSEGYEPGTPG
jgi:hypothetical protein